MPNRPISPLAGALMLSSAFVRTALVLLTLFTPAARVVAQGALPSPSTRAERTNYLETSSHADVIAFLDALVAAKAPIHVSTLATSTGGKVVPIVVASRPVVTTPAEARRLGRPVVYVQANIHAGEVEGKEAVLALLRDWTQSKAPNVLDSLVVIVVPIYNTDGNDKLADQSRNRGAQNGPAMIGERPNGAGLDLNRDYVKAEAPETRGALAAFNAWNPDLFMDLHTTNGSYHGYALTYSQSLHPAAPLAPFTIDTLLPEIRRRMRAKHNFEVFPYGNFASEGGRGEGLTATDKSAWYTYEHKQRFGTNYYGLRGPISILSEAYSHDPFSRRVASTRAFVQEILSYVAENRRSIAARIARTTPQRDFGTMARGAAPQIPITARFQARPDSQDVLVEVLERGDSTRQYEPGTPRGIVRTGRMVARRMPVVDRFDGVITRTPSVGGYAFPATFTNAADLLRLHGVAVTALPRSTTSRVSVFDVDSVIISARPFQGHREASVLGRWRDTTVTLAAGTFVVRNGSPLDLLAMQLLEPESDDGLLTWNTFDSELARGALAPVMRLAAPLRTNGANSASRAPRPR
jgi:hypothetical protein